MPQLKSRRKSVGSSRANLRLVPTPKPRRRARAWKVPRSMRGIRRPKYANHAALHAYEEEVVLATLRGRGGYGSVESLMGEQPDRWRPTYLGKVFRRLYKQRRLERFASRHSRRTCYDLPRNPR